MSLTAQGERSKQAYEPPPLHELCTLLPVLLSLTSQLLTGDLPEGTFPGHAQDGLQQSQKRVVKPAVPPVGGVQGIGAPPELDELLPELDEPPELLELLELEPDEEEDEPELELEEDLPPELDPLPLELPAVPELDVPLDPELLLEPELLLDGFMEDEPLELVDPPTSEPELLEDGGVDASSPPPSVNVESPGELPQATTIAAPTSARAPMVRRNAK